MLKRFLDWRPAYAATAVLDELRAREFGRLDEHGHVYLDFTGAGLYAAVPCSQHAELLEAASFGNPHSANPSSTATTELGRARPTQGARVLQCDAGDEYTGRLHPRTPRAR